jgi:hypothetical protein
MCSVQMIQNVEGALQVSGHENWKQRGDTAQRLGYGLVPAIQNGSELFLLRTIPIQELLGT